MPGFNLLIDFKQNFSIPDSKSEKSRPSNSLYFRLENPFGDVKKLTAFFEAYEGYPFRIFDLGNVKIFLEGEIFNYSHTDLIKLFKDLVLLISHSNYFNRISSFFENFDGDYIIYLYDSFNNKLYIINDPLGRLPLYLFCSSNKTIISRNYGFILENLIYPDIDKFGIAEDLLFGYPLGEKTFIKNIKRVKHGSVICCNLNSDEIEIHQYIDFDFSHKIHSNKNLNEITNNLVQLFVEGTKNRLSIDDENILSLSGGLDSRSVLTAFNKLNAKFRATTYIGYSKTADNDSIVAKGLADQLNFQWDLIQLQNPKGLELKELLNYKYGLNTLGVSFLLLFLKELQHKYGNKLHYFTGDGGDKAFPDHRPALDLKNDVSLLVKYLVSNKYFFSIKKISNILSIPEKDLFEHLYSFFSEYPEQSVEYKFQRFIIVERGIKWCFEGEDRNRFYFWSVAPMYNYQFFKYIMNVNDNLKANHLLYYDFINKLNPEALKLNNALWGVPIDPGNLRFKYFLFAKDRVYPRLPASIKRILRMKLNKQKLFRISDDKIIAAIFNDIFESSEVNKIFNADAVKNLSPISRTELYLLLTKVASVELYMNRKTSLENFLKNEFI